MGVPFRHLKTGNIYEAMCIVTDCTNARDGTDCMLYGRTVAPGESRMFVRELGEFNEKFAMVREGIVSRAVTGETVQNAEQALAAEVDCLRTKLAAIEAERGVVRGYLVEWTGTVSGEHMWEFCAGEVERDGLLAELADAEPPMRATVTPLYAEPSSKGADCG